MDARWLSRMVLPLDARARSPCAPLSGIKSAFHRSFFAAAMDAMSGISFSLSESPMSGGALATKWIEDKLLSTIILVAISPFLVVVAVAIKLTSPGPVIFAQWRH